MKKLISLLLCTVSFYGQTLQNPTFGIVTEKNNATDSTPAYFVTSQTDGVHKKTPAANIEKTANKSDSYMASSSTTYASTKALVDGLTLKANQSTTYTKSEVDSKISNLNTAYHVDFIDSGTRNFIVPDSIIVQNVYLNNIPVYGADWSQTGTSINVTTSLTGDKVTLTGGSFVSVDLNPYARNENFYDYEVVTGGVKESVDGYYNDDGFYAIGGYKSEKFDITGIIGELYITTRVATASFLAMAKYYDASDVLISSQNSWVSGGVVEWVRTKCIIPAGTKYIGITNHYTGFSDPAYGILEKGFFAPVKQSDINPLIANDEAILNSENLFIYNKFLEVFPVQSSGAIPVNTSFYFNTPAISQIVADAFPLFKYKGNYISLALGDIDNGGLMIMKSDYDGFKTYTNTLEGNWEIYTPVAMTGTLRVYQGTGGSFSQKGGDIPFSFTAGVNILTIPTITMDSDYDVAWLRLFNSTAWDNQTIGFGRLLLSGKTVEATQLDANINELQANVFRQSQKEQAYYSHWKDKKMVYLGDSVAYANNIQPEIVRTTGLIYSNVENQIGTGGHKPMGLGSSRIIPLIDNAYVGQQSGNSIYERADDVDFYSPDLIILGGGQNDVNATGTVLGTISDAPYTGGAVSSSPPTFISAYKGTLEKLITQNPTARIICVTPLWSSGAYYADKKPFCDAIEEIAKMYGCLSINLLNESGVNILNHNDYVPDGVHPNAFFGEIIGSIIAKSL